MITPVGVSYFYAKGDDGYLLTKQRLANGKVLRYIYTNERLSRIESRDPAEHFVYASVVVEGSPEEGQCVLIGGKAQNTVYEYSFTTETHRYLRKKRLFHSDRTKLTEDTTPPILVGVSSPVTPSLKATYTDRFQLESVSGVTNPFKVSYMPTRNKGEFNHLSIQKLELPVGPNGDYQTVHSFEHIPARKKRGDRTRVVRHCDGSRTEYVFNNKQVLPVCTRWFTADDVLKKEERSTWNADQRLESFEVVNGDEQRVYAKQFEYDTYGNPVTTRYMGDVTGKGQEKSTEVRRQFSADGRHLLLREEDDTGKVVCFAYLPETNLLARRLVWDKEAIVKREFHQYDESHNLICTIIDDGKSGDVNDVQGVTQRTLNRIQLRQQQPFLHMPDREEEYCLVNGEEKLIRGSQYTYDQWGNVCCTEVYGSDRQALHTIEKVYDAASNLLSETNAIGQKARYSYDQWGRKVSEEDFSGLRTEWEYNARGLLQVQRESTKEGEIRSTTFDYDPLDRCIAKTDYLGRTTRYSYDPVSGKVARTEEPPVLLPDGTLQPVVTTSVYDALGREVQRTDANGNTTHYAYNLFGSITKVVLPDGHEEHTHYSPSGVLREHIDRQGLRIEYEKDVFGRTTRKIYKDAEGHELGQEKSEYTTFHLIKEIDREGGISKYTYDPAGRKVIEEHNGRMTRFVYDDLGHVIRKICEAGEHSLVIHYQRDKLGRVLSLQKRGVEGSVLYRTDQTYDPQGNVHTRTRYIHNQPCTEKWDFDGFGREICYVDALGRQTTTSYAGVWDETLARKLLVKTVRTPDEVCTKQTLGNAERMLASEVLSSEGIRLRQADWYYDPVGNEIQRNDHVYVDGTYQSTQTVHTTYTVMNQVESCTRAYGTPDARCTKYTYRPSGQKASQTKPDGTTLHYTYDSLGALVGMHASDQSVQISYRRDKLGRWLQTCDDSNGTWVQRELNAHGEVVSELWSHGKSVRKTYDARGRITSIQLPGIARTDYGYNALYTSSVCHTRLSDGVVCEHSYQEYDLDGNVLKAQQSLGAGKVTYQYDASGRIRGKQGNVLDQSCRYDDRGRLVETHVDGVEFSYSYDALSQLAEEHSPYFSKSYVHDSNFNRVVSGDATCEINDLNERLSDDLGHYAYDANGNTLVRTIDGVEWRFAYDALNRLVNATTDQQRVDLQYDSEGRRVRKCTSQWQEGAWVKMYEHNYLYHGETDLAALDHQGDAQQQRVLAWVGRKACPETVMIELEGQVYVPTSDCQGNVRRLWNPSTSALAEAYEYAAFGHEVQNGTSVQLRNPWRYASKPIDVETGLVYFGKRYYDPLMGRWLTTDPAGFVNGTNLYAYLLNSPFVYVDPDGCIAFVIPLLYWGGAAGLTLALPSLTQLAISATLLYGVQCTFEALERMYLHSLDKRHTPDQEALVGLTGQRLRPGVSNSDADTLLDWADEHDYPHRDDRGKDHWEGGEHIHIGNKHVPVND